MAAGAAFFAFLGTAGAIPSVSRDNTSLVFAADGGPAILVDCGGSPGSRLRRCGVDPLTLSHVVVTHIHPDHAYGLPSLVQTSILLGRSEPLEIVCRPEHVDPLRDLLRVFRLWQRAGAFSVTMRAIADEPGSPAFSAGPLVVWTSPNQHGDMPNFAVRVGMGDEATGETDGPAVVYSSDTAPCDAVAELAQGADTLIHEATFPHRDRGRFGVHSTAREAGEVAARAGVRRLILTHIEADYHDELPALADEARKVFGGEVEVARELVRYPFPAARAR